MDLFEIPTPARLHERCDCAQGIAHASQNLLSEIQFKGIHRPKKGRQQAQLLKDSWLGTIDRGLRRQSDSIKDTAAAENASELPG